MTFILGLALFAMFFGAGNLIFPLFVGQIAGDHSISATCGFLLMGVVVPFLGVLAMLRYRGDYVTFFRSASGRIGAPLTLMLLTVWIPLGSAPRCITLGYASLATHLSLPPLWIFSLLYCALVLSLTYQRNRVIAVLGYFLTPLLLLCLGAVIFKGILSSGHEAAETSISSLQMAFRGAKEGYNTMDLIASFFFSASILKMLKNQQSAIKTTLLASLIAILALCLVYVGLIQLAAHHSSALADIPKEGILPFLAHTVLGPTIGMCASFAIVLACLTTSVALTIVYVDFLSSRLSPSLSMGVTLLATFGMSILGLQGITQVTGPLLQLFYPLLIGMILLNFARRRPVLAR